MELSRRWNKFWIGLALGVVLPIIALLLVYFFGYRMTTFDRFIEFALKMHALPKIISLCVLPNLAVFYLFLNKEYWYATRGIIAATLLCAVFVLAIKFLV